MLPELFARWMAEALPAAIPEESEATCGECAMQPRPGEPPQPGDVYFGDAKCCTYLPSVFNFEVGRALLDGAGENARCRAVVERMIDGAGVTPLGIAGRQSYWLLYRGATDAFGRAGSLVCPLYQADTGRCGIWRYRESTCATWHCKHDRGAVGHGFWRALQSLLHCAEQAVALHCAVGLDLGVDALPLLAARGDATITPADLDDRADADDRRRRFGRWAGRERDFFRACAGLAEGLRWSDIEALMGVEGRLRLQVAREAVRRHADQGPVLVPLRLGRHEVVRATGSETRVTTYSPFDPLDLPRGLLEALRRFDGRTTEEALREIAARDGLDLQPDLVRLLVDFELLQAR